MLSKITLNLLLIIVIVANLSLVDAQDVQNNDEVVYPGYNQDSDQPRIEQDRVYSHETITFRAMVRAQNLARAAYLNQKYGQYFTSGETKFTSYTLQESISMFTGGLLHEENPQVVRPNQDSVRNLQESQLKGQENDIMPTPPTPEPGPVFTDHDQSVNNNADNGDDISSISNENSNTQVKNQQLQSSIRAKPQLFSGIVPRKFSVDWAHGPTVLVTSVKNQGTCGSCWAFSGLAQLQSYLIKYHKLYTNLAQQQIVDCARIDGCNGAFLTSVSNYVISNGVTLQKHYPYRANNYSGACTANAGRVRGSTFKIKNFQVVTNCNLMTNVITKHGPLNVCMYVDSNWFVYKSGVIPSCNQGTSGHCVLLVGAQSDGTTNVLNNFWKFKNSWGVNWGNLGFFQAYRNPLDTAKGYCSFCSFGGAFTVPQ